MRVYVLYDEIGSYNLPKAYRRELAEAGAVILPFRTSKGMRNRFQINFRNHRKIVIVDGHVAYVGGMNVGDEYMGRASAVRPVARHARRSPRARRAGDSVCVSRRLVLGDRRRARAGLDAAARRRTKTKRALPRVGSVGHAGNVRAVFHARDQLGQQRIWIASPYFVPDASLIYALQLAALRGVDVRVMLPERPDHKLVYLAGFSYIAEAEPAGVKFYRYQPGFMHHKVILVDDDLAAVGTANFDNRSMRLNFEMMLVFADKRVRGGGERHARKRLCRMPAGDGRRAGTRADSGSASPCALRGCMRRFCDA